MKWNQTYVIQDVKLATCGSVAAIGSYNGREIYVQNTEKQLGTITTTMPIRNITVADTGRVTATLADHQSVPEWRAVGGQLLICRCRSGEIQRSVL